MTRRAYLLLALIGLAAVCLVALYQHAPGYMDADYYYAGGLRLAGGHGFSELFLWNYLDDPKGLPHPSHAYWMPLSSLVAAAGMKLSGLTNFYGARLGFLLVAAFIPPLTAALSFSLTGRRNYALFAGLLAAFPAFYLAYLGTTDNFGLYMLLGGLWFIFVGNRLKIDWIPGSARWLQPLTLGLLAGFMHLARSDGILWLLLSFAAVISVRRFEIRARGQIPGDQEHLAPLRLIEGGKGMLGIYLSPLLKSLPGLAIVFTGYLFIMGPWMLRNLSAFGTLLSPQGGRALWLADYNELYSYPAALLTPSHWLASGFKTIFEARWYALGQNLQSTLAVQGYIFLTPLILLGLWELRSDWRIRLGIVAWLLTLLMMTVVFPFQGWRGGFFHSGAALQPLWLAIVPVGLEMFINWGKRVRGWQPDQAGTIFRSGLLVLVISLSIYTARGRVIGSNPAEPIWAQSSAVYTHLEQALTSLGAEPSAIVAVNNPAGFYIAAARPAIPIPNGNEQVLFSALRRYNVRYVLLEINHPPGLNDLYNHPEDFSDLRYLKTIDQTRIFVMNED